jgi:transcriptional regulator with XRE-family HTH domain
VSTRRYCRCGTQLAGDNTARWCDPCQATRRLASAPDMPPEFWQTEVMTAALDSGDLGRVLRAYRCHPDHGRRLSQALVAGWLHMSQAAVCRIEQGRRRITIDEIANIARALGLPVAIPWASQHEVGEDVDRLNRRSLLGAGIGAAVGLNATTAPAAASEIDPELALHWMKLLCVLGRHDTMVGPHDVLVAVRHELGLIARHRQIARGELQAQLIDVESRWAWFASWLSHDAGDWRPRDAWADRALQLARAGGDPDMVAWVVLWQSQWAAMRHDPRRAVALADAARDTPGTTDKIRAVCTLRKAHGHALAGDRASCERSLADAYTRFERSAPSTDATLCDNLGRQDLDSPPCVLAYEARCWLELQLPKAIQTLEETLRLWPSDRMRGRGIQHARLARACAAAGEFDRAAAEGMTALEIARATRSDITTRELKQLDRRLVGSDAPAAADFREALAAL